MQESQIIHRLSKYRRDLHKIPELGLKEYKTKQYILSVLSKLNCEIKEIGETGICAYFPASNPLYDGTLAFRCDMDGLPIHESSLTEYRSQHKGIMHACGHDGHMAMLLELACQLSSMEALPINVLLIFQPAEESPGGAQNIIKSGILKQYGVKRIFAIHLSPSKKPHTIYSRPGAFMAKSSELNIRITGRSAHLSSASKGIDALHIGCMFVDQLYEAENDCLSDQEFHILKFGKMSSGSVRNAISDHTLIEGTLRCFSTESFDFLLDRIRKTAKAYEEKYGCTIDLENSEGYPPAINNPDLFHQARGALSEFDFITLRKPSVSSDDFSFFLDRVPGVYFFLGTGENTPLHSNIFDFNEEVLLTGVKVYKTLLYLPF